MLHGSLRILSIYEFCERYLNIYLVIDLSDSKWRLKLTLFVTSILLVSTLQKHPAMEEARERDAIYMEQLMPLKEVVLGGIPTREG